MARGGFFGKLDSPPPIELTRKPCELRPTKCTESKKRCFVRLYKIPAREINIFDTKYF